MSEPCTECEDTGFVFDVTGEGPWRCYACGGEPKVSEDDWDLGPACGLNHEECEACQ